MYLYKRYIPVISLVDESGAMIPLYIIWQDQSGQRKVHKIDKILNKRKAFSKVGGCGELYECMILRKKRKLYFERDRWFIECISILQE